MRESSNGEAKGEKERENFMSSFSMAERSSRGGRHTMLNQLLGGNIQPI